MFGGLVGVLGAGGGVGRVAVRELAAAGVGPLRLGARRPERVLGPAGADTVPVDVTDPAALRRFCTGCAVVLNCAGPAAELGDRAALAARAAGAHYVDASGDDAMYQRLVAAWPASSGRTALISAGMMPGLTALLTRYLAAKASYAGGALTGYVGGRDRFTYAAAADYLAVAATDGRAGCWWRAGRPVAGAEEVRGQVPFFAGPVAAHPYLSREIERVAVHLGLSEVRWYSVYDGEHLPAALRRYAGVPPERLPEAARALCRAAELDLFGRRPYHQLVLRLSEHPADRGGALTLALRGTGAIDLTGAAAALATERVWRGPLPPGPHHAGEVLEPVDAVRSLAASPAVLDLTVTDDAHEDDGYEEDEI
jgi:hypothetical protein